MVLEIKQNKKQGSHILVRQFIRRVQQSGILLQARKIRFFKRSKTKQAKKETALRREKSKEKYNKIEKNRKF